MSSAFFMPVFFPLAICEGRDRHVYLNILNLAKTTGLIQNCQTFSTRILAKILVLFIFLKVSLRVLGRNRQMGSRRCLQPALGL